MESMFSGRSSMSSDCVSQLMKDFSAAFQVVTLKKQATPQQKIKTPQILQILQTMHRILVITKHMSYPLETCFFDNLFKCTPADICTEEDVCHSSVAIPAYTFLVLLLMLLLLRQLRPHVHRCQRTCHLLILSLHGILV